MSKEKLELQPWQTVFRDLIDSHEDLVAGEEYQSLSDYDINRLTCISMCLPKGSGHTTMTAYIAANYPAAVLYVNMEHWKEICSKSQIRMDVEPVSIYELHYAMLMGNDPRSSLSLIEELKKKIQEKKVIVIDRASELLPGLKDWILTVARGVVVFLG